MKWKPLHRKTATTRCSRSCPAAHTGYGFLLAEPGSNGGRLAPTREGSPQVV